MNNYKTIKRRKSDRIYVGNVPIGNNAPISIQSMTNTRTTDIVNTIKQINQLKKVGVDIIRISVPTKESVEAFKIIRKQVNIPLIADIHFDYRLAIKSIEYGADCLRINPGNIGQKRKINEIINCARYNNVPIRIGINSGSLERDILQKYKFPTPEALVESAMRHVEYLNSLNFNQFKVSVKTSDVFSTIKANKILSKKITQPIHIGITESGSFRNGTVKSSIGISQLLSNGIGDTLRISLAADPTEEVKVGYDILKVLGIRYRGINFIACPTCSRQEFDVIKVVEELEKKLEDIEISMNISIIGCVVNGIGEAKIADLGITGGYKTSGLYNNGVRQKNKLNNEDIVQELEIYIRKKADELKKIQILNKNNI